MLYFSESVLISIVPAGLDFNWRTICITSLLHDVGMSPLLTPLAWVVMVIYGERLSSMLLYLWVHFCRCHVLVLHVPEPWPNKCQIYFVTLPSSFVQAHPVQVSWQCDIATIMKQDVIHIGPASEVESSRNDGDHTLSKEVKHEDSSTNCSSCRTPL